MDIESQPFCQLHVWRFQAQDIGQCLIFAAAKFDDVMRFCILVSQRMVKIKQTVVRLREQYFWPLALHTGRTGQE